MKLFDSFQLDFSIGCTCERSVGMLVGPVTVPLGDPGTFPWHLSLGRSSAVVLGT